MNVVFGFWSNINVVWAPRESPHFAARWRIFWCSLIACNTVFQLPAPSHRHMHPAAPIAEIWLLLNIINSFGRVEIRTNNNIDKICCQIMRSGVSNTAQISIENWRETKFAHHNKLSPPPLLQVAIYSLFSSVTWQDSHYYWETEKVEIQRNLIWSMI